ncbi:MAG: hypothetical protein EBT03_12225 [Betaproteobacteria bacterium]|nr:hypothetical protein [Betaproteobacteria bacterium]
MDEQKTCECPYQDGKGDANWHAEGCPAERYHHRYLDSDDYDDCLICPYCGDRQDYGSAWETLGNTVQHDGDRTWVKCDECDREYRVTLRVTYEFQTGPVMGEWKDGYHQWHLPTLVAAPANVRYCRVCGIVRRADGQNKPCPGKVSVALRGEQEEN